jgi:ribosome maturation factor RimP
MGLAARVSNLTLSILIGGIMKRETEILNLIKRPLDEMGIIVDSISYVKENGTNYLRISIDKDNFIDIDDCVNATKIINPILDTANIINETYILDVCSKERGGDNSGC